MAESFTPPQNVRDAARRGLELRKKWGRGGLSTAEAGDQGIGSGVQRATNLANGDAVSLDTIQRMANFFSRHEKNRGAGEKESDGGPTAGAIAWALWGGDAGRTWAERILREQDDSMKAGNRNNRSDRQRIRDMRQHARAIVDTTMEMDAYGSDEEMNLPDYMARPKAVQIDPAAHPGAMVALMLTPEQQAMLQEYRPAKLKGETDHLTMVYLADDATEITEHKNEVLSSLASIASAHSPIEGYVNGYGRFSGDDESYPVYVNFDSPQLPSLREMIVSACRWCGMEMEAEHGFTPHITLGYLPTDAKMPVFEMPPLEMTFDCLCLVWGGERIDLPFGSNPVTESAEYKATRQWNAENRRKLEAGEIEGDFAGPDNTYPIAGPSDVGDAWNLAGQAAEPDMVRRNVIRIARRFGWESGLPQSAQAWMDEHMKAANVTITVSGAAKGLDLTTNDTQPLIVGMVRAFKSADGEWVLDVLGVPFGGHNSGKDSDGEYFSRKTNIYQDKFPSAPAVYFHGWDENNKPASEPQYIGIAKYERTDDKGHWYKVVLNKANEYAKRVWEAAKQGIARASSGSITHLVRKERDGHITHWPVAELSIFDAVGKRQPANQYAVALPALKSVYAQAGLSWPADIYTDSAQAPEDAAIGGDRTSSQRASSAKANETEQQDESSNTGVFEMDENQVKELVAQSVAAVMSERDAAAKAITDRQAEIKNAAEAAAKATREQMQAELDAVKADAEAKGLKLQALEAADRRLPGGVPYVAQYNNIWKYDDLDADDLALAVGILDAAKRSRIGDGGASEDLRKALAIRIAEKSGADEVQYRASKSAMKAANMPMKANELNQSTLASYGDEWIGVTYSTQIWDKVRLATPIVGMLPTVVVPQGSESIVIPIVGTSPSFYKVAQASAQDANPGRVTIPITTSRMNTTNKTLTVAKLGAAVNYTGELEEDSLLPWVSELRRDLTDEAAEILEHVVIDGDTATGATTNINDIGGTPGGTEAFLLFDGFRKLCLVTNTANSRDGASLGVDDYLETVKLLGAGGRNAADKSKVAFIIDMATHWKSLTLTQLATQDVNAMPTIESGMLTQIYGYKVYNSANMHRANTDATYGLKANSAGKVDLDTASNNTTGSILAVRWDQWRFGYKRRLTFEIQRDAISDTTAIVCMMRAGLVNRDTEASSISYNLTV